MVVILVVKIIIHGSNTSNHNISDNSHDINSNNVCVILLLYILVLGEEEHAEARGGRESQQLL